MNECGVVNIYMIMMSYLFAPCNEADGELGADGKTIVRAQSGSSNDDKELAEIAIPQESPPELQDHQQMTSIEMSDSD